MKEFLITALLAFALAGTVVFSWDWFATRPTDEAGTQAMLEEWEYLQEMAEKYPYKEE